MTDRARARVIALRRALVAGGAVFATVFALLAVQLWFGNDPALGDGAARATQDRQQPKPELHASVLDTVLSVATGLLADEHGDDDGGGGSAPAVSSRTS